MHDLVLLTPLRRYSDHLLLVLRIVVGAFLVWGVWDNITSPERMEEFASFLAKFGFPAPERMAPLSVWVQFAIGIGFIAGLLTRWAGLLCAINFAVAVAMVDWRFGLRGAFPATCLILMGLYLAAHGAGRFSLDVLLERRLVKAPSAAPTFERLFNSEG